MAQVTLRPIRMSDAERCFSWRSNPEVNRFLGLLQATASLAQERSWIAGVLADREHHRTFIIENEQGTPVGTCGLRAIDRAKGTALLGILIGETSLWNQGLGTAATRALLDCAFGELGLSEVRLTSHVDNRAALRCYQKAGFRLCRREPGASLSRPNEVQMAIDRQRWRALQGRGERGQSVP